MSTATRRQRLRQRAEMLARLRAFFAERGVLEVETPLLDAEVIPELHIEPFPVRQMLWLQASPELHMKRLLAEGLPAIYQVTRSFRQGERGALHNPEFTIVEWYRAGDGLTEGMQLLDELCQVVGGTAPARRTTYAEAFTRHAGVDAHRASCKDLAAAAARLGIDVPRALRADDRDEWLNLLLALHVEPRLGAAGPEILLDYPASQAALATTLLREGVEVAERFELYWRGIELANGYHELTDAAALRARLETVNAARASEGRQKLPLPERLLSAMASPGLPPCAGCALGLDRLTMLACGAESIAEVMAFPAD
ncbi:MAG TPA: EF-P lysine aminoacylase EpmA [Lacipirellulaceae bacterium]|nr:EF-P lysine aminoacylase EpmA [Lacipirellulaceae bacterium]